MKTEEIKKGIEESMLKTEVPKSLHPENIQKMLEQQSVLKCRKNK